MQNAKPLSNSTSDRQDASVEPQSEAQPVSKSPASQTTEIDRILHELAERFPKSRDIQKLHDWKQDMDWLSCFGQSQRLLMAAVRPDRHNPDRLGAFAIAYASDSLCQLARYRGSREDLVRQAIPLSDWFADFDRASVQKLYRRHLLRQVLRQFYRFEEINRQLLDEPIRVSLATEPDEQPRLVEFWLRSDRLRVRRINTQIDEFADVDWQQSPDNLDWMSLEQQLRLDNYDVEGLLLLEGIDVTVPERIRHLTRSLIDRESILETEKFKQVNRQLRSLFRAPYTLILSAERDRAQLMFGSDCEELLTQTHSMKALAGSHFMRAADANRVLNVADLNCDCQTDSERALRDRGVRSMLLIPLVVHSGDSATQQQLAGLIGLASDRPHHFNSIDRQHAEELIPAFSAALRQAIQQRVSTLRNIHPAVAWRFLQEAERRSWGLPPEPIVFRDVYPLYGISDIRGSSSERNRAIQTDLLEQFHLGLAIVEAACNARDTALCQQLRLDLLEYIERLHGSVTVDAEVTAIDYLRTHLEIYFDYFSRCSPAAETAVRHYRQACDNEHQCVYTARARYDAMLHQINQSLVKTWECWQQRMQQVIPHYCDLECSDGIDHMIYIGRSIYSSFTPFHLHSLRYEQLRAVCDCARTAFGLLACHDTTMEVAHLVLVQDVAIDIFHDENTEKLFDVRGTRDIRYEIVKKRIDKAVDRTTQRRITQPGMLTVVYSTDEEWLEYQQYLRYLAREGWVDLRIESGTVEPLQGVTGLKFARVPILPSCETNGSGAANLPGGDRP
jgi:plasmid maintenance system killer protein